MKWTSFEVGELDVVLNGLYRIGDVRGRGATVEDINGREYIDGLSGLWNVNVGHGRAELAQAAAAQMTELAYFSGYVGSSNVPAITLANRLMEIAYDNMQAVFFTTQGARPGETVGQAAARELEETILGGGSRHDRRLHRRANPRRWRRLLADRRLLAARARGLHTSRRAAHHRRNYHRLLPHRALVCAGALECETRPALLRQGVTSGYLPLGGIMVNKPIKEAMDSVAPAERWMDAYTYSAHPTCCAESGMLSIRPMSRKLASDSRNSTGGCLGRDAGPAGVV